MSGGFDFDKFRSSLNKLPSIPGTKSVAGSEFWYFEAVGDANNVEQFQSLLDYVTSTCADTGGTSLMNCEIMPTEVGRFLAIAFRGDLLGWRNRIEEASNGLNRKIAKIEDDQFIVLGVGGRSFRLSECQIRFFRPERSKKAKPSYREDIVVKRGIVYKV